MKMLRNRSLTNTLSLLFFLGISLPQVASESEPVTIDYTQCKSAIKIWESIGGWVKHRLVDHCCSIENRDGELVSGLPGVECHYEFTSGKTAVIWVTKIDWSYKPGSKYLTGNLTGKLPSEIGNLVNLGELNLSGNPGLSQVLYPVCDTKVYYEGTNITVDRTLFPCKSTSTESSSTNTESSSTSTESISTSTESISTSTESSSTADIVYQITSSTIDESQTSEPDSMSTDCATTDIDDLVIGSSSKVSLSLSALLGLAFFI